jgi:hypothetical protein
MQEQLNLHDLTTIISISTILLLIIAYTSVSTWKNRGEPPSPSAIDQEWETNIVSFAGFADLSTPKGKCVVSSKFISLGREWCVDLYPRGDALTTDETKVSVSLRHCSPGTLKVEYSLAIRGVTRRTATMKVEHGPSIGGLPKGRLIHEFNQTSPAFGYGSFSTRDEILARRVDGALRVTVKMRHAEISLPFIPDNPATCKIVRKMFMNEEFADIIFEIGKGKLRPPSVFHAHRMILKNAAPQLEEICMASDQAPTRVRILDVSPDTFATLLLYIYGCAIPDLGKEISRTKAIIEAADKYGVTNLKLEAEVHYVASVRFNLENIVDNLLLAEARNCALLKERVMKFMVNNAVEIVEKETLKDFPGGLLNDVLTALSIKEKKTTILDEEGPPSPSTIDREWETNIVSFAGFTDLSTPKGKCVKSSIFVCLGREWCVWLYPRGDNLISDETKVSVYLALSSPGTMKVEFGLAIGSLTKGPVIHEFTQAVYSMGYKSFSTRDEMLARLVDGALMVEVKMRHAESSLPFIPENPATCKIVKKMFMNEEFADIIFEIGGGQLQTPSLFHAHRMILKNAAPQLEEICVASDQTPTRLQILGVSSDAFKALLLYIYGCAIPDFGKEIARTKEIMEAADKYGVTNLKLEAEAHYVSSIKFEPDNIVENLLFAEARNCAVLKERVMKYLVNNAAELVEKQTLKNFPGRLLNDSLTAIAIKEKEKKIGLSKVGNEPMTAIPICELRRRAQEKGVDVDGTREMLISALDQD